ncbi:MAG TPA: diadenylate cyclase CdaA, partial [Longilinea sp.]|nr:diadenylate cyclase CdaA [Longilinea sp.]
VVFYAILMMLRDTQAIALLRGFILLVVLISLLASLVDLPAFSWLIQTSLPALLLAIPVIFAPEIRRGLERLGRAGAENMPLRHSRVAMGMPETIKAVVAAAARLSARQHGALIILERNDVLNEYVRTGVQLNAAVTAELLMQIFYPNTPLHDGAVIIEDNQVRAAACVMPLSASGILNRTPDRQMGLRHRAALGISEASDAVAVVVSEETGSISIAHGGRMIRRLDTDRLENILLAFYRSPEGSATFDLRGWLRKWWDSLVHSEDN